MAKRERSIPEEDKETRRGDKEKGFRIRDFGFRIWPRWREAAEHSKQLETHQTESPITDHGPLTTDKSEIPIPKSEIRGHSALRTPHSSKVITADRAAALAADYRAGGHRVVFTNGCFDLLHVGHLATLEAAAAQGDVLFVGVNSDSSVRRLKGAGRPIISERDRALLLAGLECIDHVVIFSEDTPSDLIQRIGPTVLVKGGSYRHEEVAGREIVEARGGKAVIVEDLPGVSTTRIVSSIRKQIPVCSDVGCEPRPVP